LVNQLLWKGNSCELKSPKRGNMCKLRQLDRISQVILKSVVESRQTVQFSENSSGLDDRVGEGRKALLGAYFTQFYRLIKNIGGAL